EGHSHSHVHEGHSHSHVHEGHSHSHVHEGHSHSHVHEGHSHSHVHEGHSHSHGHEEPSHPHGHRPWVVIRDLIDSADLTDRARGFAQDAFQRLAKAESFAHGIPMEQVEFHEVGSDDAIADIVGTAVAIDELNIHTVIASPFPLGRGLSRGAHGALPIPGPATLHILEGAPVLATPLRSETVTPTGAALVRALASHFGPIPSMTLEAIGVGAGHKRWPDRPNIVRAILGSQEENSWLTEQSFNHHYHTAHNNSSKALEPSAGPEQSGDERSRVLQLETNIDDMNPEHLRMLFSELFVAGALDVWATSSMFKKGRLGWVMGVLVPEDQKESVLLMLFKHSSTLGVRWWWTDRQLMSRSIETVVTPYGSIRVKRSQRPGAQDHVKPEHDDVLKAATEHRVPMRVVEEMVLRQVWQQEQA
ncbi:MAG: DUF111 family protein, partial [Myxococcales bacterium]|nr:DUF111 family protein [Myxococcales bacterium]